MKNPLNIKIGNRIKGFFESGNSIVRGFVLVNNKELSLANPVTMRKFQDYGEFWAISMISCEENMFKCFHLVPIDMIKKNNL